MAIQIVEIFFRIYMVMLFIRIMGSWLPEFQRSRFMQFLSFYTDPYLNIFRRLLPPIGMLDISPILAFFCLMFIEEGVKWIINALAA